MPDELQTTGSLSSKAASVLRVSASPRNPDTEYATRQATCLMCPRIEHDGKHNYCGACGCPHWPPARLSFKNRMSGHKCPLGEF